MLINCMVGVRRQRIHKRKRPKGVEKRFSGREVTSPYLVIRRGKDGFGMSAEFLLSPGKGISMRAVSNNRMKREGREQCLGWCRRYKPIS